MKNFRYFLLAILMVFFIHFGGMSSCGNSGDSGASGGPGGSGSPLAVEHGRNPQEYIVPASLHPLNERITVLFVQPDEAEFPTPLGTVLVNHGSGGLFNNAEDEEEGSGCSEEIAPNYAQLRDYLTARGYNVIMPSHTYSEAYPSFCEDSDYEDGPGFPAYWDDAEASIVKRFTDLYATMRYVIEVLQVDPARVAMVGTSDGGMDIIGYVSHALEVNLQRFYEDEAEKLALLPVVSIPDDRPLPDFAVSISGGCGMHGVYPFSTDVDELSDDELYAPHPDVGLYLEIGDEDEDEVPEHCTTQVAGWEGTREIQYAEYLSRKGGLNNYDITIRAGGLHDLLGGPYGDTIREKIVTLAQEHF